jgi:hypothetical protein
MGSSIKSKRRSAAQLAADGFAALVQKLGMAEAVRYVQLYDQGAGDYTRERHEWLNEISPAQVTKLMAAATKKQPHRKRSVRTAK